MLFGRERWCSQEMKVCKEQFLKQCEMKVVW